MVVVRHHFDPIDTTYGPKTKKIIFKMLMNVRNFNVTFSDFWFFLAKKIGNYIVFPVFKHKKVFKKRSNAIETKNGKNYFK